MRKIRYVVGKVDGPLDLAPDERGIFAGRCTNWEGEIDGQAVNIGSSYKTFSEVDETKTESNDMLLTTLGAQIHAVMNRNARFIRVKGCPLSVAQHVNYLSSFGKIKNPNFDPRLSIPAGHADLQQRYFRQ